MMKVNRDGATGKVELASDLFVRQPLANQMHDLAFARSHGSLQVLQGAKWVGFVPLPRFDIPDRAWQQSLPGRDLPQGVKQQLWGRFLENNAVCAPGNRARRLGSCRKTRRKKPLGCPSCSDLIAASNRNPLRSSSRNGSSSAKSGDRSRMTSRSVFPSRQLATTLKSLSAHNMLCRPHKTTGWRSAITILTQRRATFEHSDLGNRRRIGVPA